MSYIRYVRGISFALRGTPAAIQELVSRRQLPSTTPIENTPRFPRGTNDRRIGTYDVLAPIARGGMGGVYLGSDASGTKVALKVLDPHYASHDDIVQRMFAEKIVSSKVAHPGLLEVRAAERSDDGMPFLVMEYLDGENLGALADRGQLEIDAITAIGTQIATALCALHDAGVIHCDIKLDNIFVLYQRGPGGWPRVKVIDYGVAKLVDEPPMDDNAIAGTPACMPPEQWRGTVTTKSDVYALGCLLYELVCGETVFQGTLPQLMLAHSEKRPARPSWLRKGLSPGLERLILRALSKDPGMRPTMKDMAIELQQLMQEQTTAVLEATG
jgi:serine/threonine protein kinase